jgi:Putative  PD-(D/E)XK family member, (DUF4420)
MITASALSTAFATLPPPVDGALYSTAEVAGCVHRIGRSVEGRPALVFRIEGGGLEPMRIRLRGVQIAYRRRCAITLGSSGRKVREVTIVELASESLFQEALFFKVAAVVADELANETDDEAIRSVIDRLVSMFRALNRPNSGSVLGVWGELLYMCSSPSPVDMLRMWRSDPKSIFDFWSVDAAVEVKTTVSRARRHSFALHQLAGRHVPGTAHVVSIMTQPMMETGTSVMDLADRLVRICAGSSSVFRIHEVIWETLGEEIEFGSTLKWDDAMGIRTLSVIPVSAVPRVSQVDPGVSNIRFVADLGRVVG